MANITGVAKRYDGLPVDYVSIFNWSNGKCIAQVKPDAQGNWTYEYSADLNVGITYVADGCEPLTHGAYVFETVKDPYWQNVVSLLHFDGGIIDLKGNAWTALGSPALQSKNGLGSIYLNGVSQALYANIDLTGNDDLTIELFLTLIDGGRGRHWARIMHTGTGNQRGTFNIVAGMADDNPAHIGASLWEINDGAEQVCWMTDTAPNDTVIHVAVTRTGGSQWSLYINGVRQGGFVSAQQVITNPVRIGSSSDSLEFLKAYIHTMRITKGVARYTSDFAVPDSYFPRA